MIMIYLILFALLGSKSIANLVINEINFDTTAKEHTNNWIELALRAAVSRQTPVTETDLLVVVEVRGPFAEVVYSLKLRLGFKQPESIDHAIIGSSAGSNPPPTLAVDKLNDGSSWYSPRYKALDHNYQKFLFPSHSRKAVFACVLLSSIPQNETAIFFPSDEETNLFVDAPIASVLKQYHSDSIVYARGFPYESCLIFQSILPYNEPPKIYREFDHRKYRDKSMSRCGPSGVFVISVPTPFCPNNCTGITIDLLKSAAIQLSEIEASTVFDVNTGCYNKYAVGLLESMYYNGRAMKRISKTLSLRLFGQQNIHRHRRRSHHIRNKRTGSDNEQNQPQCPITVPAPAIQPPQTTNTAPATQFPHTTQHPETVLISSTSKPKTVQPGQIRTACTWIINEFSSADPLFVRDMLFIELRVRCPATIRPHKDLDGMRLLLFEEIAMANPKKQPTNGTNCTIITVTTRIIGNIYLDNVKPSRWTEQSVENDTDFFLTIGNTKIVKDGFSYFDANNTKRTHIPDLGFDNAKVTLTAKHMTMRRVGRYCGGKSSAFAFALVKIKQDKFKYMSLLSKISKKNPSIAMTNDFIAILEDPLNSILDVVPFSYGSAITNTDFFKRLNPLLNEITDAVIIDAQVAVLNGSREKLSLNYCGPNNDPAVIVAMGSPTYWRSARATPGFQNLCARAEDDGIAEIPMDILGGPSSSRISHTIIRNIVDRSYCAEPECENMPSTSTGSFGDIEMAFGSHSNIHENAQVAKKANEAANSNKRSGSVTIDVGEPQTKLLRKAQSVESAQAIVEQAVCAEQNQNIESADVEEIMGEIEDNTQWWDNNQLIQRYSEKTISEINNHAGIANFLEPRWFSQSWVDRWQYDMRFLRLRINNDGAGTNRHGENSVIYCSICEQGKILNPNAVIKQQQSKIVQGTFNLTSFQARKNILQKIKEHYDGRLYPSSHHWTYLKLLKDRNTNAMQSAIDRANQIVINKQSFGSNAATIKFLLLVLQEVLLNLPSYHHQDLSNHIHTVQMINDDEHSQSTIHHSRFSFNSGIDVIDHYIRESFLKHLMSENVKYISIISDGCTSRRSHHYVAILFRFGESMKAANMWTATTLLYRLITMKGGQTAEAHQQRLEETLQEDAVTYKLPNLLNTFKRKLYSFASDGASVNLGSKNGWHIKMQTWIGRYIIAQHDAGHKLELAVSDAWQDSEAFKKLEEFSQFIYRFVVGRKLAVYEDVARDMEERSYALLKIQATRWVASDHRALQNVFKGYGPILEAMKIFMNDSQWRRAGRAKEGAEYIWSVMKQRHFLPTLAYTLDCLTELNKFSKQVQTDKATVADTLTSLAILKERISNLKFEKKYGNFMSSLLTRAMCSSDSEQPDKPEESCRTLYNWETSKVVRYRDILIDQENPTSTTLQEKQPSPDLDIETVPVEDSEPEIVYFKRLSLISWKLNRKLQKALDDRFPQNSQMAPLIIFERNTIENQLLDGNRSQLNAERAGLMATTNIIPAALYLNPEVENDELLADEYISVIKELVTLNILQSSKTTYMLWSRALGEPKMSWGDGTSNSNLKDIVMRFMTIPVGSAAAERVFSKTNRILTDSRNRIAHETLEKLTCIQFNSPPPNRINSKALVKTWFKTGHKKSDTNAANGPSMFSERELRHIRKMEQITGITDHEQAAQITWSSLLTHDHNSETETLDNEQP